MNVCDTTPLALEWGLFDMVDTLATSMSSEDHAAVILILRSLVMLLHNGLFNDALREHGHGKPHEYSEDSSLKHLVEECDGKIRTKWALLGHLKYYLQYLYVVSPTEAELFADVHELSDKVERYLKEKAAGDENANDDRVSSNNTDDMEIDDSPETALPAEPAPAATPECVLCKYNVPGTSLCRCFKSQDGGLTRLVLHFVGHIHPGREPIAATPALVKTTPFQTKTSKSPHGKVMVRCLASDFVLTYLLCCRREAVWSRRKPQVSCVSPDRTG